jgi:hypothetical protein
MLKIWSMVCHVEASAGTRSPTSPKPTEAPQLTPSRKRTSRRPPTPKAATRRKSPPRNSGRKKVRCPRRSPRGSNTRLNLPLPSLFHLARSRRAHAHADPVPPLARADVSELSLGDTMRADFPTDDDIMNFVLTIEPDEGMYKGGSFRFSFAVNQNFPHEPPKVKCVQKIYHPNIDLDGNVCLNILREDWKPVLNLNAVIVGLQVRFFGVLFSDGRGGGSGDR